jgi:thiamine biosynthesis lipoprotein
MTERRTELACFGGRCAVRIAGDTAGRDADAAVALAVRTLRAWHERFTRFDRGSELSRVNADPRAELLASRTMARLVAAVADAAAATGGLVDGTLTREIEAAGYRGDLRAPLPVRLALRLAPPRWPAAGRAGGTPWWDGIAADPVTGRICRPPGLAFDSGGLAKGLFADLLADALEGHGAVALDCAGDLRIAGRDGVVRRVEVADPFGGPPRQTFELRAGGVATSGIGRRAWLDPATGRPAHHLLDPATGRPAYTGIVQATALAPTALEAEIRAKAALLSGPAAARAWLSHGGLVVLDDGTDQLVEPPA